MNEPERATRIELAGLYRLFDLHGWTDLVYTHLSARLPDRPDQFLILPYGMLFEEVRASNLVRVEPGETSGSAAADALHRAVLHARPDVRFVLHAHTPATVAVGIRQSGLLPLCQHSCALQHTLGTHGYQTADAPGASAALVEDLGARHALLLRNHGSLVCGRTAAEAWLYQYFLERACLAQVQLPPSGGQAPPPEEVERLARWGAPRAVPWGTRPWRAMLRLLERRAPDYRD